MTLDVTFDGIGTDPHGKTIAGFTADTTINRKDFGLNWNVALETGGVLVSDNLTVQVEVEAVLRPTAASLENVMLGLCRHTAENGN